MERLTHNQRRRLRRPRTRTRPRRSAASRRRQQPQQGGGAAADGAKPFSKLTWEERKALEDKAVAEGEAADVDGPALPRDTSGNVRQGVRVGDLRPMAPRNTTQVGAGAVCSRMLPGPRL